MIELLAAFAVGAPVLYGIAWIGYRVAIWIFGPVENRSLEDSFAFWFAGIIIASMLSLAVALAVCVGTIILGAFYAQ